MLFYRKIEKENNAQAKIKRRRKKQVKFIVRLANFICVTEKKHMCIK